MEERLIRFQLFGQEFSFYSAAPENEVEQVISLLQQEFAGESAAERGSVVSTKRIVFGCLQIAATLVQERGKSQSEKLELEHIISALVEKVASHLN